MHLLFPTGSSDGKLLPIFKKNNNRIVALSWTINEGTRGPWHKTCASGKMHNTCNGWKYGLYLKTGHQGAILCDDPA